MHRYTQIVLFFSLRYEVKFLGHDTKITYQYLNDHWAFPLESRVRSLAVHLGLVSRMPWEVLVFGEEAPIADMPAAVRIDDDLLVDCKNTRACLLRALAKKSTDAPLSFCEMKRIVMNQCSHLKEEKYDRFSQIDMNWLFYVAEKVGEKLVRDSVLTQLSLSAMAPNAVKDSLAKLAQIRPRRAQPL